MRQVPLLQIGILSFIGLNSFAVAQTVSLRLASGSGTPGRSVSLPITIASTYGAQASGIQWSLTYSTDITGVTVAIGTSGMSAQKFLSCDGNQCIIIGLNRTTIPDGTVAIVTLHIASHPSDETIPIKITGVVVASPEGRSIPATAFSGVVSMRGAPPSVDRSSVVRRLGNTANSTHSKTDGADPAH